MFAIARSGSDGRVANAVAAVVLAAVSIGTLYVDREVFVPIALTILLSFVLPRYELTMREKIKSLRGATATSGTLERAADVLKISAKSLTGRRT